MITTYTYSVSNDTLNGKVSDTLPIEIGNSSIVIALNNLTVSGDILDISFETSLTNGDKTLLDGIVGAHEGIELEPGPQSVQVTNVVKAEKPSGASLSAVSHDFCKRESWYSTSQRVTGQALTDSGNGLLFTSPDTDWINLTSGLVPKEDTFSAPYLPVIYIDGAEQTSGFTINHSAGEVIFDSVVSGVVMADYSKAVDSKWILQPPPGYKYLIEHAELDFTTDVIISPVHFEVWVYDPNNLPNKMLYERITYKNYKDILKIGNSVDVVPSLPGIANSVLRVEFDYGRSIDLASSVGAELRILIDDDQPFLGEFGTITLYLIPEAE